MKTFTQEQLCDLASGSLDRLEETMTGWTIQLMNRQLLLFVSYDVYEAGRYVSKTREIVLDMD